MHGLLKWDVGEAKAKAILTIFEDENQEPMGLCIPAIPDQLTAQHGHLFAAGVLLAPTGEDEQTSFRVICMSWNKTKLFLFVFSSITGQWGIAASPCWGTLGTGVPSGHFCDDDFSFLADARGCLYIILPWSHKLIILDTLRMEFSVINNVPSLNVEHRIVVSADGSLRMVSLSQHDEDDSIQLENNIPLPRQYTSSVLGVTEGFLFLGGTPRAHNSVESLDEYFSLDVKTSELKKVCGMKTGPMYYVEGAYFGFPPSLSEPCL
uniref:Uncharacterized protein n=1 Tax=Setaria italica TaxID=4555 RepID=K3ZZY4_SETIT